MIEKQPDVNVAQIQNPVKKILAKYQHAKSLKDQWLSVFEECYEYALPQRESFFTETAGRRRTDHIFDETAVVLCLIMQDGLSLLQVQKYQKICKKKLI
jgi:hypothetical protein